MNKIAKRTAHCLKISESLIQNSVKLDGNNEKYNNNAKSKTITVQLISETWMCYIKRTEKPFGKKIMQLFYLNINYGKPYMD